MSFGTNKIMKQEGGDGQTLQLVKGSPFLTIQGEGPHIGRSAVFIRLHGCHLRCIFCDTEFDNKDDPVWNVDNLLKEVMAIRNHARLAVITGGEPMRQNILCLCRDLKMLGFTVQIETAGTFWIDGIETAAEIVCSPKTPTIHPMIYKHAAAFKYVLSCRKQDFDFLHSYIPVTATQPNARPARLARPRPDAEVYLSPMDEGSEELNAANRRLVGLLAKQHGVIAGVQLHKLLELA